MAIRASCRNSTKSDPHLASVLSVDEAQVHSAPRRREYIGISHTPVLIFLHGYTRAQIPRRPVGKGQHGLHTHSGPASEPQGPVAHFHADRRGLHADKERGASGAAVRRDQRKSLGHAAGPQLRAILLRAAVSDDGLRPGGQGPAHQDAERIPPHHYSARRE